MDSGQSRKGASDSKREETVSEERRLTRAVVDAADRMRESEDRELQAMIDEGQPDEPRVDEP